MTVVVLVLRFIGKHWQILAVIAAIAYLAWFFHSMRDEIDQLTYINERQKTEITLLSVQLGSLRASVDRCNESVTGYQEREQKYIDTVEELKKKPPKIIYKYKDRVIEVDSGINADTCEGAVAQMAEILGGIDE